MFPFFVIIYKGRQKMFFAIRCGFKFVKSAKKWDNRLLKRLKNLLFLLFQVKF